MRTPLNALLGYGHLLETVPLEDEHREQVHKLNQAGQALLALVDDVLDLSKIEAGEFHLAHEPLDLSANLDQVRRLMAVIAAPKGLDLVVAPLPAGLPRHYLADPPRLRQILVNLVGNALKFTPRGQVRLSVQALPGDDPTHQRLRFEVSDTGIGISAADQARAEREAAEDSQGVRALDAAALAELKAQLAGRRMTALTNYRQLVPGLRRLLARDDVKRLDVAMERLDFQTALEILGELEEQAGQKMGESTFSLSRRGHHQ